MWAPVALPYRADETSAAVPALPTTYEIWACTDVLYERHKCKIVATSEHVAVKFGGSASEWEGQALIYLERYVPEVPAPRLYAMYRDSGQLFLVMQRASGERLDRLWPSLTNEEKDVMTEQLRRIFDVLRQAECPWPNFFGGLDGGGVHHYLFWSQKGDQQFMGPFHDETSFVKGLTDNFRAMMERNRHPTFKVRFYEAHLSQVLRELRPVLTHGDLHRMNIMAAEKTGSDSVTGGPRAFDIMLIDWEMSGWLPQFWEYFCASLTFDLAGWDDDWCWRTGQVLPPHLAETAVMRMFDKDMA